MPEFKFKTMWQERLGTFGAFDDSEGLLVKKCARPAMFDEKLTLSQLVDYWNNTLDYEVEWETVLLGWDLVEVTVTV